MTRFLSLALFTSILAAGCSEEDLASELTIENQSSYTLINIYLSPVDDVEWGPDLLGEEVLEPGESLQLSGISCDTYDIRVVDEDDDECVLSGVDLCLDDAHWRIDDSELIGCQL